MVRFSLDCQPPRSHLLGCLLWLYRTDRVFASTLRVSCGIRNWELSVWGWSQKFTCKNSTFGDLRTSWTQIWVTHDDFIPSPLVSASIFWFPAEKCRCLTKRMKAEGIQALPLMFGISAWLGGSEVIWICAGWWFHFFSPAIAIGVLYF